MGRADRRGEFPAMGSNSDIRARIAYVCFSVSLNSGESCKVRCIEEQQHDDDIGIVKKIFMDFYRLSDRLNDDVTAMAIFTGSIKNRDEYQYSCYRNDDSVIKFRTKAAVFIA